MTDGRAVTSATEAPWSAVLAVRGPGPLPARASCSGVLVAPDEVLTAAHCVVGPDGRPLGARTLRSVEVHVGATTLSTDPGTTRGVRRVQVHPGYALRPSPAAPDDPAASGATHDLAVLVLDSPVPTEPLRLATRRPPAGTPATLWSHGTTGPDEPQSDALRAGAFRTRAGAACAALPVPPTSSATCATARRVTTCTGDSGGPLVARLHGRPVLLGLFSYGPETTGAPCGTRGPDVFTSVPDHGRWLAAHLRTGR
jgi:secreted trypsin-like serine protease